MRRKTLTAPHIHLAFGTLSFLLGFAFIIGGPARASAPAYAVIAEHGGPYVWGTVFVVLGTGLILSVNRIVLMRALLLAGAVAYAVLCAGFLVAALASPGANLTAVVAYGGYSAFHICALRRSRRSVAELRDARRVAALRELMDEVSTSKLKIRASDSVDDACDIAIARARNILSQEWE